MAITIISIVVFAMCVFCYISSKISILVYKKNIEKNNNKAKDQARQIIEEAEKEVEKKKELFFQEKNKELKYLDELNLEVKKRMENALLLEKRNLLRDEKIESKINELDIKIKNIQVRDDKLKEKEEYVNSLIEKQLVELEKIANLTREEAKEKILKEIKNNIELDKAKIIENYKIQLKKDEDKIAREYIVSAIQRCAADCIVTNAVSIVDLPNNEMKGRIIGREGRNIRSLEAATGVDIIIDDTPNAIVLSSFDTVRREICKISLEKLMLDGRIHPARIEETVLNAEKEVNNIIKEKGEKAVVDLKIVGIHPDLINLIGRLYYRTSYGQNILQHSIEVAKLSGIIAAELGEDSNLAVRAGLLHDIGKAIDGKFEGSHVQLGAEICKKYNESEIVINAIEYHHGDKINTSLISCIVQAADAISASKPGARNEILENYINRLQELEKVASDYEGVNKSYAIQAGREIRVFVIPEKISDSQMTILAHDIAKNIEKNLNYPGQIKVNVIRETRVIDVAK